MSKYIWRLIGPWGNAEPGPRYVRPEGDGALDQFGKILEAASGDMVTCTVDLAAVNVQALGTALRRVASGEDARHVFGQNKVGNRQEDRLRIQTIALVYWKTLAELLAAGDVDEADARRRAVVRGQSQFTDKQLDAATVTRYARKHRESSVDCLARMRSRGNGPDLRPLRRYIAKHSHKGR